MARLISRRYLALTVLCRRCLRILPVSLQLNQRVLKGSLLGEFIPPRVELIQLPGRLIIFSLTHARVKGRSGGPRRVKLLLVVLEPQVVGLLDGLQLQGLQLEYFVAAALDRCLQMTVQSVVDGHHAVGVARQVRLGLRGFSQTGRGHVLAAGSLVELQLDRVV